MNTREIREYKRKIQLTDRHKEVIIGSILGDGHLEVAYRYPKLRIEHSYKQKEYVDWKYEELKTLVLTPPKERKTSTRHAYGFNTLSFPQFDWYQDKFGGRKIPPEIKEYLTPLVLAVWFMDDGSVKSRQCRGLYLQTQAYNHVNLARLRTALLHRYEIVTTITRDRRLYFPSKTAARKLREIISLHVLPSMRYKCQS